MLSKGGGCYSSLLTHRDACQERECKAGALRVANILHSNRHTLTPWDWEERRSENRKAKRFPSRVWTSSFHSEAFYTIQKSQF